MNRVQEIRQLFAYNAWANERMLEAAAALSAADFARDLGSSFPSVCDTLQHIAGAEWVWLERWRGRSPGRLPAEWAHDTLPALAQRWRGVAAERQALLEALDDADLDRVIEYRNFAGAVLRSPLWQILRHVVNHSTYHRGQVTTMLRQLGAAAPATDLIHFYRAQEPEPAAAPVVPDAPRA